MGCGWGAIRRRSCMATSSRCGLRTAGDDPHRSGSTQFVERLPRWPKWSRDGSRPGKPATASTGGRLVCLTDGREYTIGAAPLIIGREAGSDIVVPNKDVSRHHAEILATPQGYVVVDSSTNGTFVNGERIEAQRVLARADVIRVGDHDFRFYADRAPDAPPPGARHRRRLSRQPSRLQPFLSRLPCHPSPLHPSPLHRRRAQPATHRHHARRTAAAAAAPVGVDPATPAGGPPRPQSGGVPLANILVRSGAAQGTAARRSGCRSSTSAGPTTTIW